MEKRKYKINHQKLNSATERNKMKDKKLDEEGINEKLKK